MENIHSGCREWTKPLPTAENLLRNQFCKGEFDEIMECLNGSIEPSLVSAMKEFAKLHVEQALKEASEKVTINYEYSGNTGSEYCTEYVNKDSILNSYSLDNIK